MYNSRLQYKREKNASMAQAVKVFINSLYGKFGEKHHDLSIIMNDSQFNDEQEY